MSFDSTKPYIIVDIGSNWCRTGDANENLNIALTQIELAHTANASAVKFQLFTHRELFGVEGDNKYSLPKEWLPKLASHAKKLGIEFLCSAFSVEGVREVSSYIASHKLASSEMGHWEMVDEIAQSKNSVIISTGAQHYLDVQKAIEPLRHKKLCVLECVAAYPAEIKDYNLNVLRTWLEVGVPYVGVSDHTIGNLLAVAAVGAGATVFEKHFDGLKGQYASTPDSPVSVTASELASYVREVGSVFKAVGKRNKLPSTSESEVLHQHKRRLVVIQDLKAGERLQFNRNFGVFRSTKKEFTGVDPSEWRKFDGRAVKDDVNASTSITRDMVN